VDDPCVCHHDVHSSERLDDVLDHIPHVRFRRYIRGGSVGSTPFGLDLVANLLKLLFFGREVVDCDIEAVFG